MLKYSFYLQELIGDEILTNMQKSESNIKLCTLTIIIMGLEMRINILRQAVWWMMTVIGVAGHEKGGGNCLSHDLDEGKYNWWEQ